MRRLYNYSYRDNGFHCMWKKEWYAGEDILLTALTAAQYPRNTVTTDS
jgi:hypothetical protein